MKFFGFGSQSNVSAPNASQSGIQVKRRFFLHLMLVNTTWFIVAAVETFLGIHFVLRLFGANERARFFEFLDSLSRPFVEPFTGLFNDLVIFTDKNLDVSTLVAMVVYYVAGYLLVMLFKLFNRSVVTSLKNSRVEPTTSEPQVGGSGQFEQKPPPPQVSTGQGQFGGTPAPPAQAAAPAPEIQQIYQQPAGQVPVAPQAPQQQASPQVTQQPINYQRRQQ